MELVFEACIIRGLNVEFALDWSGVPLENLFQGECFVTGGKNLNILLPNK